MAALPSVNYSPRISDAFFWPLWVLHPHDAQTYIQEEKPMHIEQNKSKSWKNSLKSSCKNARVTGQEILVSVVLFGCEPPQRVLE